MDKSIAMLRILLFALLFPKHGIILHYTVAGEADIAYTCTIYTDDKPACTGTLISRMWVLTTCLCVKDFPNTRIYIRIGDPYINKKKKHRFYAADKVEIHPQCLTSDNEYQSEHDIAMIMLNEPFFDSRNVFIAKVPHQLMYWTADSDAECDLAAWTDLNDKAKDLDQAIWQSKTQVVPPAKCKEHLNSRQFDLAKNTCAKYHHKNGKNDCALDLGAPLGYNFILIGLLVQKKKCGTENGVASFVNVPLHSEWIRDVCNKNTPWISL